MSKYSNKQDKPLKTKKFGDARDRGDYKGQRSTMPPRQRDGKTYAGGKRLRKAMQNLGARQTDFANSRKQETLTKPGSMQS